MQADVFRVPESETVWIDADLTISATTAIVIEGRLIARDAAELGRQDAPSIELVYPLVIDVPGELLGGRGADGRTSQGGSGSNLVLCAPMVRGYMLGSSEPGHVELRSGACGKGGAPGGDGDPSGDAIAQVPREVEDAWSELQPQSDEVLRSLETAPAL